MQLCCMFSSLTLTLRYFCWQNPVGAGRYDIQKWEEAQHINGHNSVFRSKTGKPGYEREKFLR